MTSPSSDRIYLSTIHTFEASHVLPLHPGKCSRLHGHSWKLTVTVSGFVDEKTGFVVDYGWLKLVVDTQIIHQIDHRHLGCRDLEVVIVGPNDEIMSAHTAHVKHFAALGDNFYPSSENLVRKFAEILEPTIVTKEHLRLEQVELDETCTCKATWKRKES